MKEVAEEKKNITKEGSISLCHPLLECYFKECDLLEKECQRTLQ